MSIASTTISPSVDTATIVDKQPELEQANLEQAGLEQANLEQADLKQASQEKDTGFGSDLVEVFLVEAWEGLQQFENATLRLREGMDETTLEDIVMFGHRLRGSSGLYGYPQISQLCDMVERLAKAVPALDSNQHKLVQEFFDHVMVCFRGSLERISNGKTEGNIGLELAHLGGSNLLLSLLSNAQANTKKQLGFQKPDDSQNETSAQNQTDAQADVQEVVEVEAEEKTLKTSSTTILVGELELYRSAEQETLEYFLPEVKEHLEHIDQGFYELSQADKNSEGLNPDIVNQLFRSAHTLKGSAYMVELQFLGDVGHALEDIMIKVREEGMDFSEAAPVFRKGNKVVKEIVAILEGTQQDNHEQQLDKSLQDFQRALDSLLGLGAVIVYDDILEDEEANQASGETASAQTEDTPLDIERGFQKALDTLLGFVTEEETSVALKQIANEVSPVAQAAQSQVAKAQVGQTQQKAKPVVTIRASVERLDTMLNLVGDLLGSRTRLQNRLDNFSGLTKQLEASRLRMQAVTKEFEKHYLNPQLAASQSQSLSDISQSESQITGNDTTNPKTGANESNTVDNQALHKTLSERFDELEFDTYSDINILAGSIAEMANDLTEMQYQFDALGFELSRDATEIHGISQSLRSQIGRVRMVAMTHLFTRLDRLLKQGKQDDEQDIFFETIGEQVEIDNAILEAVFDPIVQLVKNSKTHGIESKDERLAKGKPAQGRITVQASYQRNSVILTIKDDGKGIDLEAVKAKAIERELITAVEAAALSDEEARQLIFSPGLSTAETLTSEAGRGVGMDIVASRIRSVKGSVVVDSEKDKGTTFMLYLPLTLLISDILLVGVGREHFAVPTESIRAIERLPKDIMQLGMAGGQQEQPTVIFNEMTIPVFHLAELLGMQLTPLSTEMHANSLTSQADNHLMLILETAGRYYALLLDSILDIEEVIIKSLSKRLDSLDYLLGATLSSYGDVVLLLDPQGLYQIGQERYAPQRNSSSNNNSNSLNSDLNVESVSQGSVSQGIVSNEVNGGLEPTLNTPTVDALLMPDIQNTTAVEKTTKRLLLVDDSVSVRKVLGKKLERMGYEVITANDGQDAFDILLQDDNFDALLSDLEMPRMNGYELIDAVRHRSNQTQKLPIIVMSTRARKEHVDLAKELGADDYLVKPVDEATLAQRLEQYI